MTLAFLIATKVAGRLAKRYPDVPAADIQQWCEEAEQQFRDARIRTYLPVLIEKIVRDRLDEQP